MLDELTAARRPHGRERSAAHRLRERLLQLGAHVLSDAELIAVLLSGHVRGEGAVTVAERVLHTVGGVPGLAHSHPEALARMPGLGPATAARLVAALALPARRDSLGQARVTRLDDFAPAFRPILCGQRREYLAVAVCDQANRVRAVRIVTEGSSTTAPLPLRDIIATVFRHDGHSFAIAHNHPSGDPQPSPSDRQATTRCRVAADAAGLVFHGHLIIGDHDSWSMA